MNIVVNIFKILYWWLNDVVKNGLVLNAGEKKGLVWHGVELFFNGACLMKVEEKNEEAVKEAILSQFSSRVCISLLSTLHLLTMHTHDHTIHLLTMHTHDHTIHLLTMHTHDHTIHLLTMHTHDHTIHLLTMHTEFLFGLVQLLPRP